MTHIKTLLIGIILADIQCTTSSGGHTSVSQLLSGIWQNVV